MASAVPSHHRAGRAMDRDHVAAPSVQILLATDAMKFRCGLSTLLALPLAAACANSVDDTGAEQLGLDYVDAPGQFLSLPFHPGDEESGEMEEGEGGHYIWKAPFENGQPPPYGYPESEPAEQSPLAPRADGSGGEGGGGALDDVNASLGAPGGYHGETAAAASGGLLIGGSNSVFPGECATKACAVVAYETSDEVTWTWKRIPRAWNGVTWGITFDPSIDYDSHGYFYYGLGGAPLSGSYPNSIGVSRRNPTTGKWTVPVAVTWNDNRAFDDKYYLAVDRGNDRIYMSWDRNEGNNQILYIAISTDRARTWTAPIKVNDGTSKFERVIGAYPAVDQASGVVYDAWHDYAQDIIFVDRSTDGGLTWGTDVVAATTSTGFGQDIGCVGTRSQGPAHALKVGAGGILHLVYANAVENRGFDILYTRSSNGGATWSSPVRLNDDSGAGDQFHPTLAVSGNNLWVSFYDRRDDAANCLSRVYATSSADGGLSWSANTRVSTGASNFDGNLNGPGDYSSATPFGAGASAFHCKHAAGTARFNVFEYDE